MSSVREPISAPGDAETLRHDSTLLGEILWARISARTPREVDAADSGLWTMTTPGANLTAPRPSRP